MAYAAMLIVSKRLQVVAAAVICLMAARLAMAVAHPVPQGVTSVRMSLNPNQSVR